MSFGLNIHSMNLMIYCHRCDVSHKNMNAYVRLAEHINFNFRFLLLNVRDVKSDYCINEQSLCANGH